jgi:hypothetical protein
MKNKDREQKAEGEREKQENRKKEIKITSTPSKKCFVSQRELNNFVTPLTLSSSEFNTLNVPAV